MELKTRTMVEVRRTGVVTEVAAKLGVRAMMKASPEAASPPRCVGTVFSCCSYVRMHTVCAFFVNACGCGGRNPSGLAEFIQYRLRQR